MAATIQIPKALPVRPPPLDFKDPASHANPGRVQTRHIHWELEIDLTTRLLSATATYTFCVIDPNAERVILDSRGISIASVTDLSDAELEYTLELNASQLGDSLSIKLPPADPASTIDSDDLRELCIVYTTSGAGSTNSPGACDWLPPAQAAGRPFVFTQAQAINARSLLPCQDTPSAKATYTAVVTLDEANADLQVVMSALREPSRSKDPKNSVRFACNVPVPSYLFAFAVGKLERRELSPRCDVWALPDVADSAAWEFADVEKMLACAEKLAGPYVWGRYDLLVLPPSFPYGGMENPMLTFVTPTLLSGDRSLVSVVVHEIAHSWSGNLVSCRDCKHFWVNEGFTVKLERRILSSMYGSGVEGLDAVAGRQELEGFINEMGEDHKYTALVWPLEDGDDPDEFGSCVAYEKGYNFLMWLEHLVKEDYGEDFHGFLRKYFDRFKYQAIDSDDFEAMVKEFYPKTWDRVDFKKWYHGLGRCPELSPVDMSLVDTASKAANEWVEMLRMVEDEGDEIASKKVMEKFGKHNETFSAWDPKQKLCFLSSLHAMLVEGGVNRKDGVSWDVRGAGWMQKIYDFNSLRNSEMRLKWCQIALVARFEDVLENVKQFVTEQGRMKFVRPLFKLLHHAYPQGPYAKDLFEDVKDSYHVLARKMVEKDLQKGNS